MWRVDLSYSPIFTPNPCIVQKGQLYMHLLFFHKGTDGSLAGRWDSVRGGGSHSWQCGEMLMGD